MGEEERSLGVIQVYSQAFLTKNVIVVTTRGVTGVELPGVPVPPRQNLVQGLGLAPLSHVRAEVGRVWGGLVVIR